jgi:hypothetical protein
VTIAHNAFLDDVGGEGAVYGEGWAFDWLIHDNVFRADGATVARSETIQLAGGHNVTITNNTIVGDAITPFAMLLNYRAGDVNDYIIANNTISDFPLLGAFPLLHLQGCGAMDSFSAIIENNTFTNTSRPFIRVPDLMGATDVDVNVSANVFEGPQTFNLREWQIHLNWIGNVYLDYFDVFPFALTLNTTTDVLEFEYQVNATINDTRPLYWAPWYPRHEVIHIQFDSVVNGQEVPLGYLRVYLDGVAITTLSPAIGHVLYRITAYDLNGHLYHDDIYNVNATGIYLMIILDLAVQAFFAFFSTIDNFGLEFSLLKLYVNGTRVTTNAPVMLSEMSRITIRDYANSILYNQVLNLSITGIYLDLGFAIATITFSNEYNQTVIFYLMKGGVTVSFIIPRLSSITIRLAMGDYDYEITDLEGNELETGSMTFAAGDATSFFVTFGKVSITPPGGLPDATGSLIMFCLIAAGVIGTMLVSAAILSRRPKRSSGGSTNRKYKYIIT